MSTMGTDEDAVESEPASEAVTRANGDGSVLDSRDGLAFDVGLTSDDAELVEPERSGAIRPEDEDAGLQEPQEHGHVGQVATDRAPGLVEPDETVAPYEFADEEPDPLVTPQEMSQMVFVDVVLLLPATHPVVVLQEADAPFRELRIPVGGAEGIAISYAARGLATPRPLTHELFAHVLEEFGMTLDVVRITEVRGSAFTAEMVISGRSGMRVIDCRPSDAIALALRHTLPVPIMADPTVLAVAGTDPMGAN